MPEIDITVNCQISGQTADFEYDNENKLTQFIAGLQKLGMASYPGGSAPENTVISINGQPGIMYKDHMSSTLLDLGVFDGEVIIIMTEDYYQA